MTDTTNALRALIENAMRKSFQLGQTYWQQADSDSYKENRKSGETMERFRAHLSDTPAALATAQPESKPNLSQPFVSPIQDRRNESRASAGAGRRGGNAVTVIACSFSGAAADLPPRKRSDADILEALRRSPRVSVWDMSELSWLRSGIQSLERRGLIRDDRKEPFPWIRYTLTEAATRPHEDTER